MPTTIVTDQPIIYVFTATAAQETFECDCQLFSANPMDDLTVSVNGVETTDYEVDLIGTEGFEVTLDTPCTLDDVVRIERTLSVERVTQFPNTGPLALDALNHDLNRIVALIQQFGLGTYATITIGTVTTGEPGTDVIVTNVGTSSNAILDITIPAGEDGAPGTLGAWGGLTGTLADQVDLQAELDAKASTAALAALSAEVDALQDGGTFELPIMASVMTRRTTNGPAAGTPIETATNKVMYGTLDFDKDTAEYAQVQIPFPPSWNRSTIQVQFGWVCTAGGASPAEIVVWGAQAQALSNSDLLDSAFGTAQQVSDALEATTDLQISDWTPAITVAGTPADRDLVCLQLYRVAADGADNLNGDARLVFVRVRFATDAADDS